MKKKDEILINGIKKLIQNADKNDDAIEIPKFCAMKFKLANPKKIPQKLTKIY